MDYTQDIFYDTQDLPLEIKHQILKEAKQKSFNWWVDILDCSISFARQRIEMEFNEILEKLDNSCHFVFINRKGFNEHEYLIETGFRTIKGSVEYFLWVHISENYLNEYVEKYGLQRMV